MKYSSEKTVLISGCEDEVQIYNILKNKYITKTAGSVAQTLDLLKIIPDSVVILETDSGKLSNLREIKKCYPEIPVLAIVPEGNRDLHESAIESGACDIIEKPVNPRIMLCRIQNISGRNNTDSEKCAQKCGILFKIFDDIYTADSESNIRLAYTARECCEDEKKSVPFSDWLKLICEKYVSADDGTMVSDFFRSVISYKSCCSKSIVFRGKIDDEKHVWIKSTVIPMDNSGYLICNKDVSLDIGATEMADKNSYNKINDKKSMSINDRILERYFLINEASGVITFEYTPKNDTASYSIVFPKKGFIEDKISGYLNTLQSRETLESSFREIAAKSLRKALTSPANGTFEYQADYYGEGFRWYRAKYVSIASENGNVTKVVGRIDDIHELMSKQAIYNSKIETDYVTGLKSKDASLLLINKELREKPVSRLDSMMFIDIDNFKSVNDTLGHLEGDRLLGQIGDILKSSFRSEDIASRFGGDEFLVYIKDVKNIETVKNKAIAIIDRVNSIIYKNVGQIHCSIGIVGIDNDINDFKSIFHRADYALYVSKHAGKNQYTVYDSGSMGIQIDKISSEQ